MFIIIIIIIIIKYTAVYAVYSTVQQCSAAQRSDGVARTCSIGTGVSEQTDSQSNIDRHLSLLCPHGTNRCIHTYTHIVDSQISYSGFH